MATGFGRPLGPVTLVDSVGKPIFDQGARVSERDPSQIVEPSEVTELLEEIRSSPELFDQLVPMVYDDMKRVGRAHRRRLGAGPTMQTTALVHEAFLKLRGHARGKIENRLHFQRLAACVMRQLILDYARGQLSARRGGDLVDQSYSEGDIGVEPEDLDRILAVEEALESLTATDWRMGEAAAAQLYAGYTVEEIAEMFGVSTRTIVRDLRQARVQLKIKLADFEDDL